MRDSAPNANVAFVVMADPARAAAFRAEMHSPHMFVCDEDLAVHDRFGVPRGKASQIISPHVMRRAVGAMFRGNFPGLPVGDTQMMSAEFVVTQTGEISWSHRADDIADLTQPAEIVRRLSDAAG